MIDGPNLYLYVNNSPVNFIDPYGLCQEGKEFELVIETGGAVGYVIVGGGAYDVTIRDLQTGESTIYIVPIAGIGVSLPEINFTSKPVRFTVEDTNMTSADFEGYGYIGGASVIVGGGFTIGGGIKIPQGPFIPGKNLDLNYGGIHISVSHSLAYFYKATE